MPTNACHILVTGLPVPVLVLVGAWYEGRAGDEVTGNLKAICLRFIELRQRGFTGNTPLQWKDKRALSLIQLQRFLFGAVI